MTYRTSFPDLSAKENIFEQLTRRTAISLAPRSHHCSYEGCPNRHNLTASIVSARPSIPAKNTTMAATTIIIIIIINIYVLSVTNIIVNICIKFLVLNTQRNDESGRGNHTAMDHFTQENSYRVQKFLIYLSKPTAAPNILDRTKGSLMIIAKNVEVSYCGLGEVFSIIRDVPREIAKKYESG